MPSSGDQCDNFQNDCANRSDCSAAKQPNDGASVTLDSPHSCHRSIQVAIFFCCIPTPDGSRGAFEEVHTEPFSVRRGAQLNFGV